jgi:CubicO group peptidase (beta-lactamase class C family)
MQLLAGAVPLPALFAPSPIPAQPTPSTETTEPTQAERAAMSDLARAFMQKYAMPGLSVAVGRTGSISFGTWSAR